MSSLMESQILTEVKSSLDLQESTVMILEANYEALAKARSLFPEKFLTGEGLKVFITKLTSRNLAEKNKINQKIKQLNVELVSLKETEKKEENVDIKNKILKQISKAETQLIFLQAELNKVSSLILDDSPERVKYFYEDFLMFVANCKHESLELWKNTLSTFDELEQSEEYYAGRLLIDAAEEVLRDKGFLKPSADIRIAYLNSKSELKDFRKIVSKARALRDAAKKMLDAFESDEVNFRRFSDKKNNLLGF
jgi:hypothetical protein